MRRVAGQNPSSVVKIQLEPTAGPSQKGTRLVLKRHLTRTPGVHGKTQKLFNVTLPMENSMKRTMFAGSISLNQGSGGLVHGKIQELVGSEPPSV